MKILKLLLMGFGNAGRAYAKLLLEKENEILNEFEYKCVVTGITTMTKGNLINENGIDLKNAITQLEQNGKFDENSNEYTMKNNLQIIENLEYDVLIEMTTLNITDGEPAISHIKEALKRGKHVITANKGPIAFAYNELKLLAKKNNSIFLHETTVMDGTPIFNLVKSTLPMCKVIEIEGILNSTTNFVLIEMEEGSTYENAIEEGKKRGFVEASPMMDIEGYDAAAKIAALANVLMDANIKPSDVDRHGIESITAEKIKNAKVKNRRIKLICKAFYEDNKVKCKVKPIEISMNEMYATADSTTSIISIKTDLMGKISIVEHEPEINQTAFGIFSDMITLIKEISEKFSCEK